MKKFTKGLMIAAIAVVSAAAALSLGACSGGSQADVTGVYLTPAELTYSNMRPGFNYYTTTFTQQELTIYDDNTYCLIVSSSTFSAVVLPDEGNDAKGNERDNSIVKYYGNYTAVENSLNPDLLEITLETPTRIVSKSDDTCYLDTDNWTDEMGEATREGEIDMSTGQVVIPEGTPNQTAEGYLSANAFKQVVAQADTTKDQLTFISLEYGE